MVWLKSTGDNDGTCYFDIYRTERHSPHGESGYTFAGVLGDGIYEGEVQIEIGTSDSVTFADAWLDPTALQDLFSRTEREALEGALLESCRLLAEQAEFEAEQLPRPHQRLSVRRRRAEEEAALAFA